MDPAKQTTEQLSIANRIDANKWEAYAIAADALLRACVNTKPEPTK
jgi:hypothetical protein